MKYVNDNNNNNNNNNNNHDERLRQLNARPYTILVYDVIFYGCD